MEKVHQAFTESYDRLGRLIECLTDEAMNDPAPFPWRGFEARGATTSPTAMVIAATISTRWRS
jgi:hypothetical protein